MSMFAPFCRAPLAGLTAHGLLGKPSAALPSFEAFDEVPALLMRAMDGDITGLAPEKRAEFPRRYSWPAVKETWLDLYR